MKHFFFRQGSNNLLAHIAFVMFRIDKMFRFIAT